MDEYIGREALYEKAYWHGEHPDVDNPFPDGVDAIDIKDVDAIPSADVAPVRHGRWDENGRCTSCGCHALFWSMSSTYYESPYCFECGAKMDGGSE